MDEWLAAREAHRSGCACASRRSPIRRRRASRNPPTSRTIAAEPLPIARRGSSLESRSATPTPDYCVSMSIAYYAMEVRVGHARRGRPVVAAGPRLRARQSQRRHRRPDHRGPGRTARRPAHRRSCLGTIDLPPDDPALDEWTTLCATCSRGRCRGRWACESTRRLQAGPRPRHRIAADHAGSPTPTRSSFMRRARPPGARGGALRRVRASRHSPTCRWPSSGSRALARASRVDLRRPVRDFFADLFTDPAYHLLIGTHQVYLADDLRFTRDPFHALIVAAAQNANCRSSAATATFVRRAPFAIIW